VFDVHLLVEIRGMMGRFWLRTCTKERKKEGSTFHTLIGQKKERNNCKKRGEGKGSPALGSRKGGNAGGGGRGGENYDLGKVGYEINR